MRLVWATRGRSWGFRFLLNGGYSDPLPVYDRAFAGTEGELTVCRRVGTHMALRFPDPLGRRDEAGRVIPHDIVVQPPLPDQVRRVEEGQRLVWPLLADAFANVWTWPRPPSPADIHRALADDPCGSATGDAAKDRHRSVGDPVHRRKTPK